ncbi:MAG: hypothetical protein JWO33_2271 [Caulobacteraceae bacterium]|nr:hypothetical protein [Caulobacteraceae bacterium]
MNTGLSYNHDTVLLDGEIFANCRFDACRLVYSGGAPPKFDGCEFNECEWKFDDAAARTLSFLKLMWSVGAKPAVQAAIKEVTIVRI